MSDISLRDVVSVHIFNSEQKALPTSMLWGSPLVIGREPVVIKLVCPTYKDVAGRRGRAEFEGVCREAGIESDHCNGRE